MTERWSARWQAQYNAVGGVMEQLVQRLKDEAHDKVHPYKPTKRRPTRVGPCAQCEKGAEAEESIRALVASAPPLSESQRAMLAAIFRPAMEKVREERRRNGGDVRRGPTIGELTGTAPTRRARSAR
jgi:hypothetical protein